MGVLSNTHMEDVQAARLKEFVDTTSSLKTGLGWMLDKTLSFKKLDDSKTIEVFCLEGKLFTAHFFEELLQSRVVIELSSNLLHDYWFESAYAGTDLWIIDPR